MLLFGRKPTQPQATIYDYQEPVPQEGRCTSFIFRGGPDYMHDIFVPPDRLTDERYMYDTEKVLIADDNCKMTETFGKAKVFETTPLSPSGNIEFAVLIALEDRSFLMLCESASEFGRFMRHYWPVMPWIDRFLPKKVTQFVPSYKAINPNSSL